MAAQTLQALVVRSKKETRPENRQVKVKENMVLKEAKVSTAEKERLETTMMVAMTLTMTPMIT